MLSDEAAADYNNQKFTASTRIIPPRAAKDKRKDPWMAPDLPDGTVGVNPPWAERYELDQCYSQHPVANESQRMTQCWSLRRPEGDPFRTASSINFAKTSHASEYSPPPAKSYGPGLPRSVSVDLSWRHKGLRKPTKRMYQHHRSTRHRELTFSDW